MPAWRHLSRKYDHGFHHSINDCVDLLSIEKYFHTGTRIQRKNYHQRKRNGETSL